MFGFVGYARAVVSNFDADHAVFLFCRQADIRTFRRILDGVVHDIDNDLYDQAGVHIGHQHIVLKFYANLVFRSPAIHMGKRFMENVANHLCVPPQRQGPVFDSGDGKQILRQIDQPHGIVIDGTVHFLFSIFIQRNAFFHQHTGVAADGGQRCAQIVGNGPQQVGPQLFTLGFHLGGLLFSAQFAALQNQAAFVQHGDHQVFFKSIQRRIKLGWYADHRHDLLIAPDGQIQILRMRKGAGRSARVLIVFGDPFRHPKLFGSQPAHGLF